jgi:hypothetical protein
MRNHLQAVEGETSANYSVIFREQFCIASQALADSIGVPLENLGISYDQILHTGIQQHGLQLNLNFWSRRSSRGSSITSFGRGQFLFLVKHASRAEADHLLGSGYRFADPVNIVGTIARAMQINRADGEMQIKKLAAYHGPVDTFAPGTHIAFLGLRPMLQKGFTIMVKEKKLHAIPSIQLFPDKLSDARRGFVLGFAGKTMDEILSELRIPQTTGLGLDMQNFRYRHSPAPIHGRSQFHGAIVSLYQEINEPVFKEATLLPQTFDIAATPSEATTKQRANELASLIVFRCVIPIHTSQMPDSSEMAYSPLPLFLIQQTVLSERSRAAFCDETRKEFLTVFEETSISNQDPSTSHKFKWFPLRSIPHDSHQRRLSWLSASNMEEGRGNSVGSSQSEPVPSPTKRLSLPGITVQKTVSLTVTDKGSAEGGQSSAGLSSSFTTAGELKSPTDLNDAATWTDICFKGILKG